MTRAQFLSALIDIVLINVAFALSYYVRYELELLVPVDEQFSAPYNAYLTMQAAYTLLTLFFLWADGAYAERRGVSVFNDLYRVINAVSTVGVIMFAAVFLLLPTVYSRGLIVWAIVLTVVVLWLARIGQRVVRSQLRRSGVGVSQVLVVGAGDIGRTVMRTVVAEPGLGYQIVGFLDDDPAKAEIGRFKSLGGLEQAERVLGSEHIDEVIITLPWMYQRKILAVVRACEARGVRARVVPDLFQLSLNRLDVEEVGGLPLIGIKEPSLSRPGRIAKRALDIIAAVIILLVSAPVTLLAILLIRFDSPGPILFSQTRVGERGKTFTVYKFRSMRVGAEAEQEQLRARNEATGPLFKIRNDPRQTRFGRLLRRTSIDELPQFLNVLKGEMSVVGPRPGLPSEVAQYQPWHRQRLEVKPGISGLWQISGRSDLTFDEMCLLDIYYIENWSLALDIQIMLRTIPRVLFGSGAY
ncbi:MAG TPA: undecaprenyl-phosphate glucose phosphotransferase [Anaerolineales bacterium]|nr:undecaprenyl-phosphate glucose phosphotransferase [Anaerolineales bacterium]